MAEVKVPVLTYMVLYHCDECGSNMQFTGTVLMCYPQRYAHRCTGCGAEVTLDRRYPDLVHVPVEEDDAEV